MKTIIIGFLCLLLPVINSLPVQGGVPLTSLGGQVDALAAHLVRCRRLPGLTVAVARATSGGGRQVLTRAYGVADVATNRTVDINTRFCLAGNTQSFTAATLAQLLHENESFSLDSTIQSMLGGWFQLSSPTRSRRVTVRDILSHRVGLAPYFGGVVLGYNFTRLELIRRLRHVPVMAPFRHSFVPNPLLYVLAGHLVQMINGTFWENVVTRRLFKPLRMTGSTFADRVPNWANNFALPHVLRDGILVPISSKITGNVLRPVGPSSSICSTAPDMAEWMLMLLRNGTSHGDPVLDPQVIAELFQPQNTHMPGKSNRVKGKLPADTTTNAYSLGWFSGRYRGHRRIFQNGFANYYGSFTTLFPDLGLGIFTAANGPSLAGMDNAFRALHYSIADLALGEKPWINETTSCTFPKPWLVANITSKATVTTKNKSVTKLLVSTTDTTASKEKKIKSTTPVEITSVEVSGSKNLHSTTRTPIINTTKSISTTKLTTPLQTTMNTNLSTTRLTSPLQTTLNTNFSTEELTTLLQRTLNTNLSTAELTTLLQTTINTNLSTAELTTLLQTTPNMNLSTTKLTTPLHTTTQNMNFSTTTLKTTLDLTSQWKNVTDTEIDLQNETVTTENYEDNDAILPTTSHERQRTTLKNVTDLKLDGLTTVSTDDNESRAYTEDDEPLVTTSSQDLTSSEEDEQNDVNQTSVITTKQTTNSQNTISEDTTELSSVSDSETDSHVDALTNVVITTEITTTEEPDSELMDIFDDPMFGVRIQMTTPPSSSSTRVTSAKKTVSTTTQDINSVTNSDIFTKITSLSEPVLTSQKETVKVTAGQSATTKEIAKENTINGDVKFTFTSPRPIFRRPTQPAWRRRTRVRNKIVTPKATSALDDLVIEMARLPPTPKTTLSRSDDFDQFILTNPISKYQETSTVRHSVKDTLSTFFSDVSSTFRTPTDVDLLEVMETYPPLPEQTVPKLATVLTSGQFPVFESQKTSNPPTTTSTGTEMSTWSKSHPIKSNSFSLGVNNLRPEFPSVFWAFSSFVTSPIPTPKPRRLLLPSRRRLSNRHRQLRRSTVYNYDSNQSTSTTPVIIQDDITETLLKFGVRLARHRRIKKRDIDVTTNPFPNHVGKYTNKFFGDIVIFFNRTSSTLQMEYGFYGKAQLIPRAQNNTFLLRFFSAVWYVSEGDDSKRLPRSVFLVYFKATNQDGQPERFIVPLFDPRMPPIFSRITN